MQQDLNKLIILDRDGVINQDRDDYVKTVDEWVPVHGSLEAIGLLSQADYQISIATNQSGITRGYYDIATLNAMHQKMRDLLKPFGGKIDSIFFCPHVDADLCGCRKPKPGLFIDIATHYGLLKNPLDQSLIGIPVVGDTVRDLMAGVVLGAEPHLVLTGKGSTVNQSELPPNTRQHPDLLSFAKTILKNQ
jgi:D-glycero-D-manno-heptose 1,7-bisphosphate phosphatase